MTFGELGVGGGNGGEKKDDEDVGFGEWGSGGGVREGESWNEGKEEKDEKAEEEEKKEEEGDDSFGDFAQADEGNNTTAMETPAETDTPAQAQEPSAAAAASSIDFFGDLLGRCACERMSECVCLRVDARVGMGGLDMWVGG